MTRHYYLAVLLAALLLNAAGIAVVLKVLPQPMAALVPPKVLQLELAPQPLPPVSQSELPTPLATQKIRPAARPAPASKPRKPAVPQASQRASLAPLAPPSPQAAASLVESVTLAAPDSRPTVATVAPQPAAQPAEPVAAAPVKTGPSIPASYAASNRKPNYPALSRRYEEQGTVLLRLFVTAEGSAAEVQIKKTSGHALLDEAARSAVQGWRFNPATVDGKPVGQWYQLSIPFTLS